MTACSAAEQPHQPFQGHVPTKTGDLYVRTEGQGPDLVMLHGLGDSGIGWHKVEEPIREAGYRTIIPDALGAGRSAADDAADLSLLAHVQRLETLLDTLEIDAPVLIGNSLGGSVALLFAQQHPDRVRALVLINPAAYRLGAADGRWIWAFPGVSEVAMHLMGPELIAQIGLRFNYANGDLITADDIALYAAEAARPGSIRSFLRQQVQVEQDMLTAAAWEQGHRAITCPTLILWGAADPILPIAQAEQLAADIPAARLVVFPGVGHVPQLEADNAVRDEILGFLREPRR